VPQVAVLRDLWNRAPHRSAGYRRPVAPGNTQDVDVLLRRSYLDAATKAFSPAGFIHAQVAGVEWFLDGPSATPRSAVHVLLAGEKVREEDSTPAPDLTETAQPEKFRVIPLEALLRMKLTAFRLKDRVHILYKLEVGPIDAAWKTRLAPDLAARLQR
jgi:hypothetical protein